MEEQKYSIQQVSIALLYSVLSLEYFMNETYHVYKEVEGDVPKWVTVLNEFSCWALDECFQVDLSSKELEGWGDDLLFKDFKPLAVLLVEKDKLVGGKLAFMALFLNLVLDLYLKIPTALGREQVHYLLSHLKEYLWDSWQTDLGREIINPELSRLHVLLAQDFADRWQQRVKLYAI